MLTRRAAARTSTGLRRQVNEDHYYVGPDARVLAVIDGMGGAAAGEVAAHVAAGSVDRYVRDAPPPDGRDGAAVDRWLAEAADRANAAVRATADRDPELRGMGATLVLAVHADPVDGDGHAGDRVRIACVGDSRAYLVRDGRATQLTEDHSVVQEMINAGHLTPHDARHSPQRHLITRCLGCEPQVEADLTGVDVRPGDWLVLCTDGLSTVVEDEQIGRAVAAAGLDPSAACEELVRLTEAGGAPDNVTVVAVAYSL